MAINWHGNRVMGTVEKELLQRVRFACMAVEAEIKGLMKRGGITGEAERPARRGERIGAVHSKPGEPPYVQTGTLRRSITHEVIDSKFLGRVGTNVEYAKPLEYGTRNMRPRPFMRPGAHQAEPSVRKILGAEIKGT